MGQEWRGESGDLWGHAHVVGGKLKINVTWVVITSRNSNSIHKALYSTAQQLYGWPISSSDASDDKDAHITMRFTHYSLSDLYCISFKCRALR